MLDSAIQHAEGRKVRTCVLCFLFLFSPLLTHASSLEVRTDGIVNGLLKLSIYASTAQNSPFNAASAALSYPEDLLKIRSIDTSDSIFPLWSTEPEDDNGEIKFSGGTPAKGGFIFDGKLFSMYMEVLKRGDGSVSIEEGRLLASDGVGTDILSTTKDYEFRIEPAIPAAYDTNDDGDVTLKELSIGMVNKF